MTRIQFNNPQRCGRAEEEEGDVGVQKIERGISAMKIGHESHRRRLYICSYEVHQAIDKSRKWGVYCIRAADLSDPKLELRQVAYRAGSRRASDGNDLPVHGGCGVLGSHIIFASGLRIDSPPPPLPYGPDGSTRAYVFDINDPNQEIVDMDHRLHHAKNRPLTIKFGGKLYVLSTMSTFLGVNLNSFEVFDPITRTWSLLPEFPRCGKDILSYAVAGTKLFVSNDTTSVCCIDLANPTQWRPVPSMCQGGPFPFYGKALVLDSEQNYLKFVFAASENNSVLVYFMHMNEGWETITPMREFELPCQLPPCETNGYHFIHMGDQNVCLVITDFNLHEMEDLTEDYYYFWNHVMHAAVIPFRFQFDSSNGFILQFQPPHILEFPTNPSTISPLTDTLGCFVL